MLTLVLALSMVVCSAPAILPVERAEEITGQSAAYESATLLAGTEFSVTASGTLVSGSESVTLTSSTSAEWSVIDENNIANVVANGNKAVITSKSGTGVVTVTASYAGDAETYYIYVTDAAVSANTIVYAEASADEVTTDSEEFTVVARAYSKDSADYDVLFSSNDETVANKIADNGTAATYYPLKDGTFVVMAAAESDASVVASVTVEISGQREKVASYELRYLAFGNSFLQHSPYNGWPWADAEPSWSNQDTWRGMAASRVELDYFNRTKYYLTNNENYLAKIDAEKYKGANTFESFITAETTAEDILNNADIQAMINYITEYKPNILTVQLAENVKIYDTAVLEEVYDAFYGAIADAVPDECIVVVITMFKYDERSAATIKMANKYGFLVNDMTFVEDYGTGRENPYLAYEQYKDAPSVNSFGSHPGDFGHDEIAKGTVKQIKSVLSTVITPQYIHFDPESLTIVGNSSVTVSGGTAQYSVEIAPSDCADEVIWSVDNENVATISADGVLTAVNNGTVVVKAVSVYDESVMATKTVTVSGQPTCYTITYATGASDESITGMPEKFIYARGNVVLSTQVPTRAGYKFKGWSANEHGTTPVNTIDVTADTTVYALWQVAEDWTFDTDGDFEGITIDAFNTEVKNGVASGISYETGMAVIGNELVLDSSRYQEFTFRTKFFSVEENQTLTVTVTTTDGVYEFESDIPDSEMNEYAFNIANLTGTIKGFEIRPSMLECSVSVDEIQFVKAFGSNPTNVLVSAANTIINADNSTYNISTLLILNGASVVLKDGAFVVDRISGDASAITLDNANLIIKADIDGYAVIDFGKKALESNSRYIQIDGVKYETNERSNKYGRFYDSETIITVVETCCDKLVSVKYFCCNDGVAEEIEGFENTLTAKPGASMRTQKNAGIRFRAGVTKSSRGVTGKYEVVEYGYIAARTQQLTKANAELTFDFSNIVSAAAYIKNGEAVVKDLIFDMTDEEVIFTGVLVNIPKKAYLEQLSARPYMKIKTESGKEHIVYGNVTERSIYLVANAVLNDANNGLSEDEISMLREIVDGAQPDDETFVDVGGL